MTLHLNRLQIDVAAYYKMAEVGIIKPTDRVELIEGEILFKHSKTTYHAALLNILTEFLVLQLKGSAVVSNQNPLRINQITEPKPDLSILKFRKGFYSKKHPQPADVLFVIEIGDASLQFDRKVKLPLYAKAGIPEYWIVNIQKQQIEQYLQPQGEKYLKKKTFGKTKTITCQSIDFSLKVGELFR